MYYCFGKLYFLLDLSSDMHSYSCERLNHTENLLKTYLKPTKNLFLKTYEKLGNKAELLLTNLFQFDIYWHSDG